MNLSISALLSIFRHNLPDWATGLAGRGLQFHHLSNLATLCQQNPMLMETAWQAAYWRWQFYPWETQTIELCNALAKLTRRPELPDWTRQTPALSPTHIDGLRAIAAGEKSQMRETWRHTGPDDRLHPIFFGELARFSMQYGDWNLIDEMLDFAKSKVPDHVVSHVQALHAFSRHPDQALPCINRLSDNFSLLRSYLQAEILHSRDKSAGVATLQKLWREIPWHVNLTLKLHALISPTPPNAGPEQSTAVCLYSWNNSELLQQTLLSLSQSDLGDASVLILDNGSSDHTPNVLHATAGLFGNRLRCFSLPVNIGAPAARNWLFRHPEAAPFDTVVFLDDDVLLPHDWLTKLTAHFRQAGKSAIVGCRIMDQAPRQSVQMADVNLLDIEADGDFLVANSGGGELDLGLHDYTRSCLSVTGCCHMMDRERAIQLGGFDLRFNPSQFDDFDMDLRNALHGGSAVYAGTTAIRHCQRSSLNQADNEAKLGHIQGNMLKLNSKYSANQKRELLRRNYELLWDDLLAKARDLESM